MHPDRSTWPTLIALVALAASILVVEVGWRDAEPGRRVDVPIPTRFDEGIEQLRSVPLVAIHDPRAAAVASGVIFGRTEQITASDERVFLDSGLWHLLAASGQNIALVAGCCLVLARVVGAGRTTGVYLAIVAIPAYVAVVGGGASIVRAGAMAELALVAWLSGRMPHLRQLVLVAAAGICWAWPGAHRGLGMQLSFACVVALAIWATPLTRWLREWGLPSWLAGAIAATLLCSGATAPILLLRTGAAPLTGIVANIFAVPIAAGLLVVGLLGSLPAALLGGALPPVATTILLWPASQLAGLLLLIASRAAGLPAAQTTSPLVAIGVPACALLAAYAGPTRRRILLVLAAICMIAPAGTSMLRDAPGVATITGRESAPVGDVLRIGVLDIGQGDSTLLATDGEAVLVDVGPPDGRVVERVHSLGVTHVDGIVLTHDSLDHRGGFEAALASLHPAWVAMPRHAPGPWSRIRALAPRLVELCAGSHFTVGEARVDVLHPACDGHITPRTGDLHNDGAIVLLIRHHAVRVVLPADAEAPVLLGLGLPTLDLLRISHHGSRDPDLQELLARTTPQVAAISVGAGNDYGHPNPGVLATLRAAHVTTFRTDRDGTVAFDSDGRVLRLVRG